MGRGPWGEWLDAAAGRAMIVVENDTLAMVSLVFWAGALALFLMAQALGALQGTGWMSLSCGLFGVAQGLEVLGLPESEMYWVGVVGVCWTGGAAACCYGVWQWTLYSRSGEEHG